jgi:transcriptional regulator with XRE-family HTH domain
MDNQYIDTNFVRQRISELRIAANISERKLSLDLGYNPSYIKEISAGRSKPSLDALFDICAYFNITPYEFFNDEIKSPVYIRKIYLELNRLFKNDMAKAMELLTVLEPEHIDTLLDFLSKYKTKVNSK